MGFSTGLKWPRIRFTGAFLGTRYDSSGFYKGFLPAERLSASQEGLCCMEFVCKTNWRNKDVSDRCYKYDKTLYICHFYPTVFSDVLCNKLKQFILVVMQNSVIIEL